MRSENLARRLVRWFPLNWRARYQDEFVALLDAAPRSWRTTLDVIQGCVSEWSHEMSERLGRVMNATSRLAGGVRLLFWFTLLMALGLPIIALGNAICSVAAIRLLLRGWTLPAGAGTLAHVAGMALTLVAMYRRRNVGLASIPPGILLLGILVAGVVGKMDPATHPHYALLSARDLFTYVPGVAFGYLVPDALWLRTPAVRTRPEPAPATLGLTVLGLSGATKP
jgi:hypothetical protein